MTTMITELYDALKDAGASEQKAKEAAQALAHHDNRFDRIEAEIALLRKELVGETGSLRKELVGETGSLRKELTGESAALSKELQSEIGALRLEMQNGDSMLRKDLEAMENRLVLKLGGLIAIGFGAVAVLVKLL